MKEYFSDSTFLEGDPALHIVDDGVKFNAAHFLPDSSSGTIWKR